MFGGNMKGMMQKVQQMQKEMEKIQEDIKEHTETGQAGGGLVKVTLNGENDILELEIDDSLFSKDSNDMLPDLIIAAHREAKTKIKDYSNDKMQGLNLPTENLPLGF